MFAYEYNGDRHNRKRLQGFKGSDFLESDELFNQKVSDMAQKMSNSDMWHNLQHFGVFQGKIEVLLRKNRETLKIIKTSQNTW